MAWNPYLADLPARRYYNGAGNSGVFLCSFASIDKTRGCCRSCAPSKRGQHAPCVGFNSSAAMRRRDISKALIISATGAAAFAERAPAQNAGSPRYAQTAAELAAAVTPVTDTLLPGQPDRYVENENPGRTDMQQGF